MSKGGYRGGSTIVRPGSGWFSYPSADKTGKGKKPTAPKRAPASGQRPSLAAHAALARREAIAARAEAAKTRRTADLAEQVGQGQGGARREIGGGLENRGGQIGNPRGSLTCGKTTAGRRQAPLAHQSQDPGQGRQELRQKRAGRAPQAPMIQMARPFIAHRILGLCA